jgi:hypothetical protein
MRARPFAPRALGLTARDIAKRLGRSPAAIRNVRYKKHLVVRVQDETKALVRQREELFNVVKFLQGRKTSLASEVEHLGKEKASLEAGIATDKTRLEQTLAQALINLKMQRPDLFTLSGPGQIAMLLKLILK